MKPTGLAGVIILTAIVGLGLVWDGRSDSAKAAENAPGQTQPATAAIASWDDETLALQFFKAMKKAGYPRAGQYLNAENHALAEQIDSMRRELRERGTARWKKVKAEKRPIDARNLDEATLVELLYGIPRPPFALLSANPTSEWTEQQYTLVMQAVLTRGGPWDKIAIESDWRGLEGLTDQRLRELWDSARPTSAFYGDHQRDAVLTEMVRRGGPFWEKELINLLAAPATQPGDKAKPSHRPAADLEVLTALRRVQKKSDPVAIQIDQPLKQDVVFPRLPILDVALINRDFENRPVGYKVGGDYRSGRQTRWRIEAVDQSGKRIAPLGPRFGMGGGLLSWGELGADDSWTTTLDVASYLPALTPGEYTLRVMYHDGITIADWDDVGGLIVSYSPEIHLTVKPLIVRPQAGAATEIRKRVASIHDEPMKIVGGTYGKWAYDFVPPDSDRGNVLSMGLDALPTLLEILDDKNLAPRQRAEVLGILFSLTGQHDPRQGTHIVGGFQAHNGPWAIAAQGRLMSMGFSDTEDAPGGTIDETSQKAFAEYWRAWKEYVRVDAQ